MTKCLVIVAVVALFLSPPGFAEDAPQTASPETLLPPPHTRDSLYRTPGDTASKFGVRDAFLRIPEDIDPHSFHGSHSEPQLRPRLPFPSESDPFAITGNAGVNPDLVDSLVLPPKDSTFLPDPEPRTNPEKKIAP